MPKLQLPTNANFAVDAHELTDEVIAMRFTTHADHRSILSQGNVIDLWQTDDTFREFFSGVLSAIPFKAFRWETPPIVPSQTDRIFECVVIDSRSLASLTSDPAPFNEHIANGRGSSDVAVFANLRGDARLIVPCASSLDAKFAHLAAFLRTAPPGQVHKLWQALGATVEKVIEMKLWQPIWVSTAGLGVSWLHVRVDSEPKYYHHAPYTLAP